jgi:hypothetical protein
LPHNQLAVAGGMWHARSTIEGAGVIHFIEQIDAAISEGRVLAWIEGHIIDPATELDKQQQSALWLYAWAMLPHPDHRTGTLAHLRAL